jgi:hypothetical protein
VWQSSQRAHAVVFRQLVMSVSHLALASSLNRVWSLPSPRRNDGTGRLALNRRRKRIQATLPTAIAPSAAATTTGVGAPTSLSPEAISTMASARRMIPPGAREESWAPRNAPGSAPASTELVTPSDTEPKIR